MTAARRLAALLAIAAVVAGCLDEPTASVVPTPTRPPEPTPSVTVYEPGTTVWYEGLLVHVDRATATLDARGGPVEVAIRVENPASESTTLDAPIRLLVADSQVEPTRESRVPVIPAAGTVSAVLTYELQGIPSVEAATVLIGADPQHVARVPLSAEGGEAVVYQPVDLSLTGTATAGGLRIKLQSGQLRWDLPDWSQELVAGLQALTLTYDVTYLGTFAGGYAFTGENVELRLPDGSQIGARRDGHSQSIELIRAKKTKAGLTSRFEIPTGMTGRFTLVVIDGSVQRGIPFRIGG